MLVIPLDQIPGTLLDVITLTTLFALLLILLPSPKRRVSTWKLFTSLDHKSFQLNILQ